MLMQVINGQCNPIEVIGGGRAKQKDNAMPQRLEWSFSEVAAMMIHLHNHILLLHISMLLSLCTFEIKSLEKL